jgi:hypothetical protein
MKKKLLSVVFCCFVTSVSIHAKNEIDQLLAKLDKTISERPVYMEKKESGIRQLKQELARTISLEAQYRITGDIISEYQSSFLSDRVTSFKFSNS